MISVLLRFVDILFVILHTVLIIFNLSGWVFKSTRKIHLVCISLTIGSWVGLGLWFGFGYCPFTDWHWDVKRQLGETGMPASWVKYYVDHLTGMEWDSATIDTVVGVSGISALALSVGFNLHDWKVRRARHPENPD